MTPLAQQITKQLLLPTHKRTFVDHIGLLELMADVHCFEVSAVVEMARDLTPLWNGDGSPCRDAVRCERFSSVSEETAFLPAPKTWIEYRTPVGRRGFLLVDCGDWAEVYVAADGDGGFGTIPVTFSFGLTSGDGDPAIFQCAASLPEKQKHYVVAWVYELQALLVLINTPRIIGRRQHMPHRGLEKALLARRAIVGKFPLHAYTEIKLEVGRPSEDIGDDPSVEAHLTGMKARHFCRAHLRIRKGQVEIVRGHWRGDPSLGTKLSRYEVRP